ncbi:unnamed protein product [Thlaspi arvense]|uniref:Uncharacterized protein n=1 Tax=Thlaspi arvense TaxID=13288 RepID=A0AAU9SX08_THLAR|nr:unnamed protein product [Thlaspi arvense]
MIEKPILSVPSVSVGNDDKPESTGNVVLDRIRVKVEEPNVPIHSSPLVAGFEMPSSSNIVGSSLGKLPVPGVVEQTVVKTHDTVRETVPASILGCTTRNSSPCWENEEEPSALDLSLRKGVCAPHNTDFVSTVTKSGNDSGVNRSNWDLNTTMDAWEDGLDRKTRVKTTGSFFNSSNSRGFRDIETSSCRDTTVIAKSVSEEQKESVGFISPRVTLTQFDHQVIPACSLSLGLSPYPPIEKSPSLSATTSEAGAACTSVSRPVMTAGNVKSVNLRTVKSEVIEESAQVFPMGLSINRVKQEVVGRFSKENSSSYGSLKPAAPISVKAEPNNFTQSEVVNRKDKSLNHPHTPITQSNQILGLPTSSTPYIVPCPSGISSAPTSLNGATRNPCVESYPDYTLNENSGQSSSAAFEKPCEALKHGVIRMPCSISGHGDHNHSASGVNVSLTEEKILGDSKIIISKELPGNSRGTGELLISDEEKVILSGKELEEEKLYSYGFESDCAYDLKKQFGKRYMYDDGKVQRPAAVIAEGNGHTEFGGSETEKRDSAVPFHGGSQNCSHVEEKESQPAILGNTVEIASTEVQIKRLTPEIQSGIFDGSGENEGRIVQDGEHSTHKNIHASEVMSGVSTLSGGNVENPETVDNSSPVSYKAEISTIDNDDPFAEFTEGSQSRVMNIAQASDNSPIKTLDASDSFVPLRMERDRVPDFPFEPRRYHSRDSDESYRFSRERYHGKMMRSPRLNFMPDKRRFSDKTEGNLHDRDTKSNFISKFFDGGTKLTVSNIQRDSHLMNADFEFDNHGSTRRGGAFMSNFHRGRRPANDDANPFPHSFTRRNPNFSFTQRGPTNKEDASAFHGCRDGEKFSRGLQSNNTEPMFMGQQRPYQGRNGFGRGRTNFSNNHKRSFPGFRSRSPIRSRERSAGPSSSFRNRSQEDFSGHTDFSHRRSPSGYRMGRNSSPEHSGNPREMGVRRHNSPPYSHRPSNAGRGRGYPRGRGYARGRGYGRDGVSFRKPYDRVVHRNHGNLNNLDPRERVDYGDDFFEGPIHSERFGVDVNAERRQQFSYRHDGGSSFRPAFNNDGCAPTSAENGPDAVRFGQDPGIGIVEGQEISMEIDEENKNSTENTSGRTRDVEEENATQSEIWQRDEPGGDGF